MTNSTPATHPLVVPTLPDIAQLAETINLIFCSGRITSGEQVAGLESDVCVRTGVKHTVAVSSGTSALMLLLKALNLPEGSEVITPSFTFAATAHALLWNNLKPVFCDIEPEAFTMDAAMAESLVTPRTSAIYPVCVFGVPGDMDAYEALARRTNLPLIFDSAQGLGGFYKNKAIGGFGRAEAFSMSPTKVVTAVEGGLLCSNDDELAENIRYMRDYGKAPDGEDMRWLGLSARMSEINALVGRWSLARVDGWIANRKAVMDAYVERLSGVPGVSFQAIPSSCSSSRNYVVLVLDPEESAVTRDELYVRLKQDGVQTKRYFYPPLHKQTLYRDLEQALSARLPVTERISSRSLALPMYSHMTLQAVDQICDILLDHLVKPETSLSKRRVAA